MIRKDGYITKETGFMLMDNVVDGKCKECATEHEERLPHNLESLHYQYKFFDKTGRWPTWTDAMEHCTDEVKTLWTISLNDRGIKLEESE